MNTLRRPASPNPRAVAVSRARRLLSLKPVYLDTETTGLGSGDEIVEICLMDDEGQLLFESLVRPASPIPRDAIRIHGITPALVRDKPTWAEVWPEVERALAGKHVAIYNAQYDLRLLQQSHARHGLGWRAPMHAAHCIMELYAQFNGEWNSTYGNYRWVSLETAGARCGLSLPNAHRAQADARLARAVLHYIARVE